MTALIEIPLGTAKKVEFQNITALVQGKVSASGVSEGWCQIFVPHTTAAVTVNEQADPDVARDIIAHLDTMVPERADFRHVEGNSAAHIKSSLLGCSQILAITGGKLALGTWQGIFFCEFDGPRRRRVQIRIVPDK
jgi:secondary thiamine-phosphate synthase enzyme